jgi:hypothetical protein
VLKDEAGHLIDQNVSEQQSEVKLPFGVAGSRELLLQQARQLPPVGDMLRTNSTPLASAGGCVQSITASS